MSKLAEKIRKALRIQPQPLGFGSSKQAVDPTMVLAGVARDVAAAAELVRRGADVVVLGSPESPVAAGSGKDVKDAIAGACIAGRKDNEAKTYKEGGFDFVVFDPNAATATALLEEEIGYVLILPGDMEDAAVRTLESFQLDAIDVGAITGPLTVRRQIELSHVAAITRKPLMVRVDPAISANELQALRETNVVVVAAEGAENVERLRKTIDALPPRARRRGEERPTPLVPHAAMAEEEEEEEHEHDHE